MAKECVLSTGYLPQGGLLRNSVDRITDRLDMTSAVYCGRKASTQTNKTFFLTFKSMFSYDKAHRLYTLFEPHYEPEDQ